jgi:DNA-binding response OmpR family regulator
VLSDKPVLIVEDNVYLAIDLSNAVESLRGRVVGPVGRVADALSLVADEPVAAAIIGFDLPDSDVIPLARALIDRRVPFVIHADTYIPSALSVLRPGIPVLIKPIEPRDVVAILSQELARFELGAQAGQLPSLGVHPKGV